MSDGRAGGFEAEIVLFTKEGGPLTKRIYLDVDGRLRSDGSACVMGRGIATRFTLDGMAALAELIVGMELNRALALGMLRPGLPAKVEVITKAELAKLNGAPRPDLIARSATHFTYRSGYPALALLDFDSKGMPAETGARLIEAGGFWKTLLAIIPGLAGIANLRRRSTSAGLSRTDTGHTLPGTDGEHVYIAISDGSDAERFLRTLHARCWLAGFGWLMVGAGGQLLERSIVDRMVGAPERLVFEGAPILLPPLAQDRESRRPVATEGGTMDTVEACPPLTIVERARLNELLARAKQQLEPEAAKARDHFIEQHAAHLSERTGIPVAEAARVVARQCAGILLPDVALPFDDPEFVGSTVRTSWPVPRTMKVQRLLTRSKAPTTACARPRSCAEPMARHGSIRLPMVAWCMSCASTPGRPRRRCRRPRSQTLPTPLSVWSWPPSSTPTKSNISAISPRRGPVSASGPSTAS